MRPSHITCAHCGEPAPVAGDGPIPKYCSASCRSRYNKSRAKLTGKAEEWERNRLASQAEEAERRAVERRANARQCPYCGCLIDHPRRVQCGAPECKRQYVNERQRDFQRGYKVEHGNYYSRQYDRLRIKQYAITCRHCGTEAVVTKTDARYCSHRCWYDALHATHAQVELWQPTLAKPKTQRGAVLKPLRRCWYSASCPMCSTWFLTDNPRHQHCSPRCGRRAWRDKRRALERKAFVAPVNRIQVYERDRWTCQLCRKPVMRDKVVPHPKAPTLDHVIPLSRGGTHEPANVQLAHYYCNSIKSDGSWGQGEQLSLTG